MVDTASAHEHHHSHHGTRRHHHHHHRRKNQRTLQQWRDRLVQGLIIALFVGCVGLMGIGLTKVIGHTIR